MDAVVIAKSKPRERCDVDHGLFWHEYRLRELSVPEFEELRRNGDVGQFMYFMSYAVEMRYIRTDGDKEEVQPWTVWQLGDTPELAIAAGLGDTAYEEAESLSPLHRNAVVHSRVVRQAYSDLHHTQEKMLAAYSDIERYKSSCNAEFAKKTRGAPVDKEEKIKTRLLKLRAPHLEILRAQATAAETAYQEAKARITQLTSSQSGYTK